MLVPPPGRPHEGPLEKCLPSLMGRLCISSPNAKSCDSFEHVPPGRAGGGGETLKHDSTKALPTAPVDRRPGNSGKMRRMILQGACLNNFPAPGAKRGRQFGSNLAKCCPSLTAGMLDLLNTCFREHCSRSLGVFPGRLSRDSRVGERVFRMMFERFVDAFAALLGRHFEPFLHN